MKPNLPPLYHISFNKALNTYLYPRQPAGLNNPDNLNKVLSNSVYAENMPPRISFAPSIEDCFRGIWPNISRYFTKHKYPYIDIYVYGLVQTYGDSKAIYTPEYMTENNLLWDAFYTHEYCFLCKVKIKRIAKVRIFNPGKEAVENRPTIYAFNRKNKENTSRAAPKCKIEVVRTYDHGFPLILPSSDERKKQ